MEISKIQIEVITRGYKHTHTHTTIWIRFAYKRKSIYMSRNVYTCKSHYVNLLKNKISINNERRYIQLMIEILSFLAYFLYKI